MLDEKKLLELSEAVLQLIEQECDTDFERQMVLQAVMFGIQLAHIEAHIEKKFYPNTVKQ